MNNTQILLCLNSELPSGWKLRPHFHDFFHMTYVVRGNLQYLGGSEEYQLVSDDLILIPPGVVHEIPPVRTLCSFYELKFRIVNQELLQRFSAGKVIVVHNASAYKNLLANIYSQRFPTKQFESDSNDSFISAILYSLVKEESDSASCHVDSSNYSSVVNTMIQFIVSNACSEYRLSDLADSLGLQKSSLCKKFRKETGCTMTEFLHYVKVKSLLGHLVYNDDISNKASIKILAETCGYYDQPYFNRVFKKYTGMSPTQFLETMRKEAASPHPSSFIDYFEKYCYLGRYPIKESIEYMRGLHEAAAKSALSDSEESESSH